MSAMSASLIAFDKRVLSEEPLLRESDRGRAGIGLGGNFTSPVCSTMVKYAHAFCEGTYCR